MWSLTSANTILMPSTSMFPISHKADGQSDDRPDGRAPCRSACGNTIAEMDKHITGPPLCPACGAEHSYTACMDSGLYLPTKEQTCKKIVNMFQFKLKDLEERIIRTKATGTACVWTFRKLLRTHLFCIAYFSYTFFSIINQASNTCLGVEKGEACLPLSH